MYTAYIKLEMGKKLTESDKTEFVREIVWLRVGENILVNGKLAKRISDEIGSSWELPMPVAASDLPQLVEEYFYRFR